MDNQTEQPVGDQIQQDIERLASSGPDQWHAPRGLRTRIVAWIIIIVFVLCLLLMIAAIINNLMF